MKYGSLVLTGNYNITSFPKKENFTENLPMPLSKLKVNIRCTLLNRVNNALIIG